MARSKVFTCLSGVYCVAIPGEVQAMTPFPEQQRSEAKHETEIVMEILDIHTHHLPAKPGRAILNVLPVDFEPESGQYYSVGYHPWHLSEDGNEDWTLLSQLINKPEVLAVGEAGLDKATGADYSLQKTAFKLQAMMAMRVRKPLVIHCVRSYNEVMELKRTLKPTNPWIIHGFRGKKELARQLTDHGFYLSYGFRYQETALQATSMDMLFLETDETGSDIHLLYEQVATHLSFSVDNLIVKVQENISNVFFGR